MKKHVILATLVAFAGFAPALHAETPSPVMMKLIQIDLDVAIHHYEKLQGLLRDTELERMIGDGTRAENPPDQERLERKISILQKLCSETREEILKLGEVVEASRAKSGAATANSKPVAPPAADPSYVVPGAALPPSATPAAPAATPPGQFALPQPEPVPPAGIPGSSGTPAPLAPPLPAPQGF